MPSPTSRVARRSTNEAAERRRKRRRLRLPRTHAAPGRRHTGPGLRLGAAPLFRAAARRALPRLSAVGFGDLVDGERGRRWR
eukprot:973688-Prymnesium_polylepis.1